MFLGGKLERNERLESQVYCVNFVKLQELISLNTLTVGSALMSAHSPERLQVIEIDIADLHNSRVSVLVC